MASHKDSTGKKITEKGTKSRVTKQNKDMAIKFNLKRK